MNFPSPLICHQLTMTPTHWGIGVLFALSLHTAAHTNVPCHPTRCRHDIPSDVYARRTARHTTMPTPLTSATPHIMLATSPIDTTSPATSTPIQQPSYLFQMPLLRPELCFYELRLQGGQAHDASMPCTKCVKNFVLVPTFVAPPLICHHPTVTLTHWGLGASFSPPIVHCPKHEHAQPPTRDHPDCPDPLVILDWNDTLPVLKVGDVCGLSEALMGDSEGRRHPLWIWTMNTGAGDGADAAWDEGTYPPSHPICKS